MCFIDYMYILFVLGPVIGPNKIIGTQDPLYWPNLRYNINVVACSSLAATSRRLSFRYNTSKPDPPVCFIVRLFSERVTKEEATLAKAWPEELKLKKLDDDLLGDEDDYDDEDYYEDDYDEDEDDDELYDDEEYYEDDYKEDEKVAYC